MPCALFGQDLRMLNVYFRLDVRTMGYMYRRVGCLNVNGSSGRRGLMALSFTMNLLLRQYTLLNMIP